MEHTDFIKLADLCLERVTTWLEDFDPDEVDFSTADGVLKIEFADGTVYVLNRQTATDQMWFAAGVRAFHYDRSEEAWRDDRDGHLLEERISQALSEKLGRAVRLPDPGA